MTSVIGDEDNGWTSATMHNGKFIENHSGTIGGQSTSPTSIKSISQQYAESMLGHEVIMCGCMVAGKITATCDKHTPCKTYGPSSHLTEQEVKHLLADSHPQWAPPVSRLEEEKSILKELNKPQPIPPSPKSSTADSPKTLDSSHKIPVNLCPASAIIAIALVIAQGHRKPGRTIYNWRTKKISYSEYLAAALRHVLKTNDGSDFDKELSDLAGVPVRHDWAAMSCLAIIEDARQAGTLVDDRPVKGGAEEFLESLMVKK